MQSSSMVRSSDDDADGAAPPRRRRGAPAIVRVATVLAVLVGLYAGLGYWAAPRFIRGQVISQIAERYHRKASIGEVRLDPFALRLEADRFNLPDADGRPMIGFDRLAVRVSPASLWRGVIFSEIALDGPRLRLVRRANGRLNIQDLAPPPNKPPAKQSRPPRITIDHLAIRRGHADWLDLDRAQPFAKTFAPVNFTLEHFSSVRDDAGYALSALTERGERLAWRGSVGLAPLASDGGFSIQQVQLPPLWALAHDAAPFDLTSGSLDLAGHYRFALRRETLSLDVDVSQARLSNAGLRARGAPADWVSLPAVVVTNVHADVAKRALSVGRIEASGPTVEAWTERGGSINLARYAPAGGRNQAPTTQPATPAWTVDLPDLQVHGGRIAFEDRTASTPVKVTAMPVDLSVAGLALPIAKPVQVTASAEFDGGGWIKAGGNVMLDRPAADLEVEAADLGLPRLQPYLDGSTGMNLRSGRASARGHLRYAGGAVGFEGAARVDDLHTTDKVLNQDFVNWRALRFDGLSIHSQPLAVRVHQVTAVQPYAKVVIGPNYVTNIVDVLNPKAAARPQPAVQAGTPPAAPVTPTAPTQAAAPQSVERKALPIQIDLVRVDNGWMDFSDLSIQPHFAAGIENLAGTVKGLSGRQDARAQVNLTGQVDRYAPVKIDGLVNYFAARSFTDVKMSFQNMELTTFSPYSGKFAGYWINKGKLNVDLHYNIDDQKLNATHRVVINQLQLGEKVDSADAVKLPVKLIVALLKDRNGVIDVPIEIQGTLDDPKFKVWPLIWRIVDNLLVKVATAPFDLLGKLVGGGPEIQYVDFAPGGVTLDETDRQKLAALAKALAERPAVNLEIPMPVNPRLDRAALADARFRQELAAAAADWLGKRAAAPGAADAALAAPKSRRAILETYYRKAFGSKPAVPKPDNVSLGPDQVAIAWLEDKLRERIVVNDKDVQQLGRARAEAVQSAIVAGSQVSPLRVFIITAPPIQDQSVRMTLSLS
jgi:uncharacterized protein involved in outer membrane biogenesis